MGSKTDQKHLYVIRVVSFANSAREPNDRGRIFPMPCSAHGREELQWISQMAPVRHFSSPIRFKFGRLRIFRRHYGGTLSLSVVVTSIQAVQHSEGVDSTVGRPCALLSYAWRYNAIVGNIGHFDNAFDMSGLEGFPGIGPRRSLQEHLKK